MVAVIAVIAMLAAGGVVALGYTVSNHRDARSVTPTAGTSQPESLLAPLPDGSGDNAPAGRQPSAAPGGSTAGGGPAAGGTTGPARQPGASPVYDPIFLEAMRKRPAFAPSGDGDLFALGQSTCGALDRGDSLLDIARGGGGRDLPPEDMGYLVASSVMVYCPQHKPMLERFIGQPLPSI